MMTDTAPTVRAAGAIRGLADDYLELTGRVVTTRAIDYRERVSGGARGARTTPANVETIRRMVLVEEFASGAYTAGLRSLGEPTPDRVRALHSAPRTIARLRWLAGNLERVDRADTSIAGQIARNAWRTVRGLGPDAQQGGQAFPLDQACPECGYTALWADPASWRVACGMPECGTSWTPSRL